MVPPLYYLSPYTVLLQTKSSKYKFYYSAHQFFFPYTSFDYM